MNKIRIYTNVGRTQIKETDTHFKIKGIPITADNAVMNGILYSAEENAKGMPSMVGQPLTLSHPESDGLNISAKNGKGMQDFYSGGNITDVYNSGGIWYADADIKKSLLAAQDDGRDYIGALNSKENIGVSTGLTFSNNEINGVNSKGEKYSKVAVNQEYDHLAMLLNEAPAGGDTTVMRFNGEDVEVVNVDLLINSVTDEPGEKELSLFAKFTQWLANHGSFEPDEKTGYNAQDLNTNEGSIMNREEMLEALGLAVNSQVTDEELKTLMKSKLSVNASEGFSKEELAEAINAAVKPLTEKLEAINAEKLQGKRDAVNKLDLGLPVTAINAMTDAELDGLLAKHGQQFVAGEPGAVHGRNSVQSDELTFATPSFMGDK